MSNRAVHLTPSFYPFPPVTPIPKTAIASDHLSRTKTRSHGTRVSRSLRSLVPHASRCSKDHAAPCGGGCARKPTTTSTAAPPKAAGQGLSALVQKVRFRPLHRRHGVRPDGHATPAPRQAASSGLPAAPRRGTGYRAARPGRSGRALEAQSRPCVNLSLRCSDQGRQAVCVTTLDDPRGTA